MFSLIKLIALIAFFTRVKGIASFAILNTSDASFHLLLKEITLFTRLLAQSVFKDVW